MANILDYVDWRGDLSIKINKLNELDNMIMSRLSCMPYSLIDMNKKETIKSLGEKFKKIDADEFGMPGDKPLIEKLSKSNRFKDIEITDYYSNTVYEKEEQFSAITIHLPNKEIYLSYCGTDNTLVGWKEDFNLSFMINIPAQIEGLKYVEKIASKYPNKMHLGGHSKGGNVAVYSAIFAKKEIQNRIIDVTNHDGPGFDKSIIERGEYKRVLNKIFTYIPQSSIIGRLLEHEEKYKIVKSIQKGIMQHDIYSWQVLGTKFVKLNEVTNGSEIINETVRTWLKNTTIEQRENFINIIYEIISATNAKTLKEISLSKLKNMRSYIKII